MNGMVYILNTRYEIFYRDRKDDVELEDADGYVDFYNKKIVIPTTHKLIQPLLTILPLQKISYEVAKLRGADIDQPKNLAKSVTVE